MLSERDRRKLEAIEHRLLLDDPDFVLIMRGLKRRVPWQAVGYITVALWLAALTVSAASQWWLVSDLLAAVGCAAAIAFVSIRHRVWVRRHATRLRVERVWVP